MHPEFGALVQKVCDDEGRELTPKEVFKVFEDNYIDIHKDILSSDTPFSKTMAMILCTSEANLELVMALQVNR